MAHRAGGVGLQLNFSSECGVPLALTSRLSRKPARPIVLEPPSDTRGTGYFLPPDGPFMNDMDEISYWIHTKRAPCLMNHDNLITKQSAEAHCSKTMNVDVPSPRKRKKKRKLSILDDDSVSTEKQHQNVYFEVSQRSRPVANNCKSDSPGSDVDFNIKNTALGDKRKKARLQKNSRPRTHKKTNKLVTSTPKNTVKLRRSLRQAQQTCNFSPLNNSVEIYNSIVSNGHIKNNISPLQKSTDKINKATQMFGSGDQNNDNKRNTSQKNKSKITQNGQFEDLSDVSGFTANYIRSTKLQSSKTPRKLRCKSSRNLAKEAQQVSPNDNMIVCVNKSTNTGENVLNCSTDSSQNIINLISSKNNDTTDKIDKTTSLLKFVDTRAKRKVESNKQKSKSNLNVSFQSQSSGASRYPKRYTNHTNVKKNNVEVNTRRRGSRNCIEFNNSDKKENPQETLVSRTRSGRNVAFTIQQRENSVLVVSNSTEQVSSMVSMNVASPTLAETRNKRRITRRTKKSGNKSGQFRQDSLRDKSGFTACFSESDDDSVPLLQRKYFCN